MITHNSKGKRKYQAKTMAVLVFGKEQLDKSNIIRGTTWEVTCTKVSVLGKPQIYKRIQGFLSTDEVLDSLQTTLLLRNNICLWKKFYGLGNFMIFFWVGIQKRNIVFLCMMLSQTFLTIFLTLQRIFGVSECADHGFKLALKVLKGGHYRKSNFARNMNWH